MEVQCKEHRKILLRLEKKINKRNKSKKSIAQSKTKSELDHNLYNSEFEILNMKDQDNYTQGRVETK